MLHICTACFRKDFQMMLPNHLSLSLSFLFLPSELADDLQRTGHMFVIAGRYQMVSGELEPVIIVVVSHGKQFWVALEPLIW